MTGHVTVEVLLEPGDVAAALERDATQGLTRSPKSLPPVWFYDKRGSELFDEITRLPEYYLTRAEASILSAHASDIARAANADVLVELGSGTSEKTRLLLNAMKDAGLRRFVPFDVSEETLREAAGSIAAEFDLDVTAVVGDFGRHLPQLPRDGRRLVAFLGGTIGNLDCGQRIEFLNDLRQTMKAGDSLLLGTDLVKDTSRLLAAYDDARGVTAAFNRNVLAVLNRELGATFDVHEFDHVALWNAEQRWIEMRLRSCRAQAVEITALGLTVEFARGEDLLTEISAKFSLEQVRDELQRSGFGVQAWWTNDAGEFLLTLAAPQD